MKAKMIDSIYIFMVHCMLFVCTSHFYGGTVTWKPMITNTTSSTIPVMFIQSYQWRRSYGSITYCDTSTVLNQSPKIGSTFESLVCVTSPNLCGGYTSLSIAEYCTDFSTLVDSSSGLIMNIENITVGSKFCVAFQGGYWTTLYSTRCSYGRKRKRSGWKGSGSRTTMATTTVTGCYSGSASWSVGTCLDLSVRSEGFINTPPVAAVISPIKVPVNTVNNITIPVIDADNDYLSCRWAQQSSSLDECGDVCQMAPGGILDSDDCSLTFNSTGKTVGEVFAVALMVEDFYNETTYTPYSSVPIQFLIEIVSTPVCQLKPTISSNLSACTAVQVGIEFDFSLTIIQGCWGTTVDDVFTMPPLYMYKGNITIVGSSNVWTITESWIPDILQIGPQVYCAIATDSAGIQSDQYCLTFMVVPAGDIPLCPGDLPPNTTVTSTSTTTTTATTTETTTTNSETTSITSTKTTTIVSTKILLNTTMTSTNIPITTASNQTETTTSQTTTITTQITSMVTSITSTQSTNPSTSYNNTTTVYITTTSISTVTVTTSSAITTSTAVTTITNTKNIGSSLTIAPKTIQQINIPLIVGLSLLSLLAILCCCCCCWWWWFFGAGARRRRRRRSKQEEEEEKEVQTEVILHNRKTFFLFKRFQSWLPFKYTYRHIDNTTNTLTHEHSSTRNSTNTQSDVTIQSCESRLSSTASSSTNKHIDVVHVNRINKPITIEGNKDIKYPIRKSDVDISKISKKTTSNINVVKLSKTKSLESNIPIIPSSNSYNFIRPSIITTKEPSRIFKKRHSVNVTKVKRYSDYKRKSSIINALKHSISISQVTTIQNVQNSTQIVKINPLKASLSLNNQGINVAVTKLSRSKSLTTN